MSGLRAPARHTPSRHAVTGPGRQIRPQLVRAAVLPTLAAGLSGAAAVIFTLQLGGGSGDRDARLWPVLAGCGLLVAGALAAALLGAQRAARTVRDRCEVLRRSSTRGRQELRVTAERLERGEPPSRPVRTGAVPSAAAGAVPADADEFWLLAQELRGARDHAQAVLLRLAGPENRTDSEQKVEVFVNLARRLQSLVHREISLLDGLEDTVEDPDLLKELFHVDHLATRIRRHAENLAVLGGAASRRQWTRPIDLSEVLRSAVAEVEQYTRVKVVPPAGGTVRGHAVADVVHLLAELVENATVFSAPDTDVVLRAERVTAGIAVEVEDRGLGMPPEEQHRMNELLGDPEQISVCNLLADGRIGLFVVSSLARRHGIAVELKSNIYGGVLAVLVLPRELLGAESASADAAAGGSRLTRDPLPPLEPVRISGPRPAGLPVEHTRAAGPPQGATSAPPGAASATASSTAVPPATASAAPGLTDPVARVAPADTVAPAEPTASTASTASTAPTAPTAPMAAPTAADSPARPVPGPRLTHERLPEDRLRGHGSGYDRAADARPAGAWSADTWFTDARPADAWPGDGRPADARPAGGRRADARATDAWPADGEPADARPGDARPVDAGATDAWPADDRSADALVTHARPAGERPTNAWFLDARPTGEQLTDGRPAVGRPIGGPPIGDRPTEGTQTEAPPADDRQARDRSADDRQARDRSADDRQARDRSADDRPAPAPSTEGRWPQDRQAEDRQAEERPTADSPTEERRNQDRTASAPAPAAGPPGGGRPPLPRRRAQEHLAPQLRDAPAPRTAHAARTAEVPVHDPGLMAAFQRGFGLAQSENP
ncbi:ATP-binding protein [Streptomyces sp. NPDC048603]|uniref:ATP-binding protein n=1 Tax=Streptomyces sp. NPDC048603 TaxID=3365577 RepID=UPI0037208B0B